MTQPNIRSVSPLWLTRRRLLIGAGALAVLAPRPAGAVLKLDITQGNVQPMPIALPDFISEGDTGRNVTAVISNNLQRSGLFAPINPAAFIEKITNSDNVPRFPDWRAINAQALVTGRITRQGDGRLKAEFRLWDVFAGQQLDGKQYFTTPDNWRRIAHIISDAIYERLTGEKGYFDSRIVFVDETGPKDRRVKRLAIMDQDGAGVRYLTRGDDLVLTPRFQPVDARNYLYVVRAGRPARLSAEHRDRTARDRRQFSRHDLRSALFARRPARHHEPAAGRQRQPVRDGSALEADDAADRHAGDRHRTLLLAGWCAHLLRDRPRRHASRSMSWARVAAPAQRISFGEGTYSTPVWSPRGDYIAFTGQARRQFLDRHHASRTARASGCSPKASTTKARPSRRTAAC